MTKHATINSSATHKSESNSPKTCSEISPATACNERAYSCL
eukprot:CAMPEP_0183574204 /NCGR_PEP_ID=MMETSP0371-20130417/132851_1 /TAXON_ID=268820 /ORGANISM="Peridinium aciculiferum, Strain PAER-2" /LENGTH=40 /DNA_ID= /DNA_START= /DNA_END= /DNA_ORIENTATION=